MLTFGRQFAMTTPAAFVFLITGIPALRAAPGNDAPPTKLRSSAAPANDPPANEVMPRKSRQSALRYLSLWLFGCLAVWYSARFARN